MPTKITKGMTVRLKRDTDIGPKQGDIIEVVQCPRDLPALFVGKYDKDKEAVYFYKSWVVPVE